MSGCEPFNYSDFWAAVASGFVGGAVGAALGFFIPAPGLIGAVVAGALGGGIAAGVERIVWNAMTGAAWDNGLGDSILGGMIGGAIGGAIGYGLKSVFRSLVKYAARISTHNGDSGITVLGKYLRGPTDPNSYIYIAESHRPPAAYFSTGDMGFEIFGKKVKIDAYKFMHALGGNDAVWAVNQQFLDDRVAAGSKFIIASNFKTILDSPSFLQKEYLYLFSTKGCRLVLEKMMLIP